VGEQIDMFVALGSQQAMPKRHVSVWPARIYNSFPHCLINGTIIGVKLT
jgi:hypothetical protein